LHHIQSSRSAAVGTRLPFNGSPMVPIHPRILVVDDEASVLMTLSTILRNEGYEVDVADGGEAAIAAVAERHYDLVLTDLNMPRVDGLAVLHEVRKRSPSTVTVMVTGYSSIDSALQALQAGAYEYLLKPVEIPELKLAVKRSLERKRFSEIDTLYEVSRALTGELEPEKIVAEISRAAVRVLGIKNTNVIRMDPAGMPETGDAEIRRALSDALVYRQLSERRAVFSAQGMPAMEKWAERNGKGGFILVPGLAGGQLKCVLCADNGNSAFEFHAAAQRFLYALAGQAAVALQNATLVDELRRNNQELAAVNAKLQELDRLKSQFLSVATHELRTPLSIILGYNAMLAESLGPKLEADERHTLGESVAACKRLIRLVNTMLDISRIEAGRMEMEFRPQDLRQVLKSVAALFQHEARRRGIELSTEIPARLPRVTADGERIQQVLINLIGNALKFTPEGGRITVTARVEKNEIAVSVADTGIGIPEHELPKVFDAFAQVRRAEKPGEGSGLGLAISKRIVEAHEGRIEARSLVGKGSTFTFALPVRARESAVSA
jgi:signal transduction histidine kinase/DNA-binding NarL/FixJ family response regulator